MGAVISLIQIVVSIALIVICFKWIKEIRQDRKEKENFLQRYEEIRQKFDNLKE